MNARTEFGSNLEMLWRDDPRMLGIRMARYKFVAKMLPACTSVLEIGAGDGLLSRIIATEVGQLTRCDLDPQGEGVIEADATVSLPGRWYDGVFALDVLEHVSSDREDAFLRNIVSVLSTHGTCIIGMPSAESQPYASVVSKAGHVNCKTEAQLRDLLKKYFHNVYLFGMNDETLHTGFGPMCQYRLALCTGKVGS